MPNLIILQNTFKLWSELSYYIKIMVNHRSELGRGRCIKYVGMSTCYNVYC